MKCLICSEGSEFIEFRIRRGAVYGEDGVNRFFVFVQDDAADKVVCSKCFDAFKQITPVAFSIPI